MVMVSRATGKLESQLREEAFFSFPFFGGWCRRKEGRSIWESVMAKVAVCQTSKMGCMAVKILHRVDIDRHEAETRTHHRGYDRTKN
jgi:hypothetical protein